MEETNEEIVTRTLEDSDTWDAVYQYLKGGYSLRELGDRLDYTKSLHESYPEGA